MTEKMKKRLADLRARQEAGDPMLCPRCGRNPLRQNAFTNALSRHAEGIYICSECGTAEALLDFMHQELPLIQWAGFRPVQPTSGFRKMSADTVAARIAGEQILPLSEAFEHCQADPDNADEYRAEAFENCPGLTELWTQPFMARYDTKDDPVVVRFKRTESGAISYSVDIIESK